MSGFAADHLVVRTPDAETVAARISAITGLPVLRGWTPGGGVQSRGVRFANGPFLDIFEADQPRPCHLGVRGAMAEAERLAEAQGWQMRNPEEGSHFPWRLRTFRRGQGALSALFVIDYDRAAPAWLDEEFSGELYAPAAGDGARLTAAWLAAPETGDRPKICPDDLRITLVTGPIAEVTRLEVSGGPAGRDLQVTPSLLLSVKAA